MKNEERFKYILGGIGFLAIVTVILLIVLPGSSGNKNSTNTTGNSVTYSKEDQNRPKAVLSTKKLEWGEIKLQADTVSEVDLKNDGLSPLDITRMSTSCGCTSVKVIFPDGKETKEYSMHKSSEKVTVEPGQTVKLKIVYRPYTMPVEGFVTRQIFLETNDPVNKSLTIDASATVKK